MTAHANSLPASRSETDTDGDGMPDWWDFWAHALDLPDSISLRPSDTTVPRIAEVTTTAPHGAYGVGQTVDIVLCFSEPVTLTGTLAVTLDTGAEALIESFTDSRTATGTYQVRDGDLSPDLTVTRLDLRGTDPSLCDAAGNDAYLSLPAGSNLADNADIRVIAGFPDRRIYVKVDASGTGSGGSWTDACTTVTDALALVDLYGVCEVWVGQGTYHESITLSDGLQLYGGFAGEEDELAERDPDADPTIIDASALVRGQPSPNAVIIANVTGVLIDGFMITGSDDAAVRCEYVDEAASVLNCTIAANAHTGIRCRQASPLIQDCVVQDNAGPGIECVEYSSPVIRRCAIRGNGQSGVVCVTGCTAFIDACRISGNRGQEGGGVYCGDVSWPTLVNCVISGNTAERHGGAVCCWRHTEAAVINCTLDGNRADEGGGVWTMGAVTIHNTVFTGNSAHAVFERDAGSRATVTHCLFHDNPDGDVFAQGRTSHTGATAIDEDVADAHDNLDGDPGFLAPGRWDDAGTPQDLSDDTWHEGDYRLREPSPCVNAGDNGAVPTDAETDLAGYPRIRYGVVDIGAFEYRDVTPPVIGNLSSRVGSDTDGAYALGADVTIELIEASLEGGCVGTVDIYTTAGTPVLSAVPLFEGKPGVYAMTWHTDGLPPDDYAVRATLADAEGNTDDDGPYLAVSLGSQGIPDLVITGVAVPGAASADGEVAFTATVENRGDGDAGAFLVGFWSHRTVLPTIPDLPEEVAALPGLAAGASAEVSFRLVLDRPPGSYLAWAFADVDDGAGAVDEGDAETNNAGPQGGSLYNIVVSGTWDGTEGFEDGWGEWHADSPAWQIGVPTSGPGAAHAGSSCAGVNLDGDAEQRAWGTLISPTVELPEVTGSSELWLEFWHWCGFAPRAGDWRVTLEEHVDGAWQYRDTLAAGVGSLPGWSPVGVDLTAYAGRRVRVRFEHDGFDDPGAQWFIDDVQIAVIDPVDWQAGEGFDNGWNGWHTDTGVWQIGAPTSGPGTAHTGTGCAGVNLDGDTDLQSWGTLTSPTVELPAVTGSSELWLEFWHWCQFAPPPEDGE